MKFQFDEGDGIVVISVGGTDHRIDIGAAKRLLDPIMQPYWAKPKAFQRGEYRDQLQPVIEKLGLPKVEAKEAFAECVVGAVYDADYELKKKLGLLPPTAESSESRSTPPGQPSGPPCGDSPTK